jgi:uncharacterized protein (UPF0264 family)
MIRLLVSVAREEEVSAAVSGGADIVDVKNPAEGGLGAAEPGCIGRIRALTPAAVPVSVAIGDAPMLPGTMALAALGAAACGVEYVKVGLFGPRNAAEAERLLTAVSLAVREAHPRIRVIAAGYADARGFGGVEAALLPAVAARAGAHGCMLDTLTKDGRCLFDFLDMAGLAAFIRECRSLGLESALAGSLRLAHAPQLADLAPDIVGVRSAVCEGDRVNGRISARPVARLRETLAGATARVARAV